MNDRPRVTAIVGTYRKGGVIDAAVDEILASAKEAVRGGKDLLDR